MITSSPTAGPRRHLRDELNQLLRFAIVGASSTLITFALYALGIEVGIPYGVAATIGYAAGIVNGYVWNRRWTFRLARRSAPAEFSRYLVVQGLGLAVNLAGLIVAVEVVDLGKVIAEACILPPVILFTYVLNRSWTFRIRP